MNIGAGTVFIPQFFPYIPVPVCTKAITPAIPDAEYKPGEGSQRNCYQMQFSCLWKNPAHHIEYSKYRVKDKEENIEEMVQHPVNMKLQMKLIKIHLQKG